MNRPKLIPTREPALAAALAAEPAQTRASAETHLEREPQFVVTKICRSCHMRRPLEHFYVGRADCKYCWGRMRVGYETGEVVLHSHEIFTFPKEKRCSDCQQKKPPTEFHFRPGNGDGLNRRCKSCRAARDRQRYLARKEAWQKAVGEMATTNEEVER